MSFDTSKKYLRYTNKAKPFAGINHQFSNLFSLLAEAAILGRTAVVTPLYLAGKHNDGNELEVYFDRYLDLTQCARYVDIIREEEFEKNVLPILTEKIGDKILPAVLHAKDTPLLSRNFNKTIFNAVRLVDEEVKTQYERLNSLAAPSSKILEIADQILNRFQEYHVVHVRRTDMLRAPWWKFPGIDKGTRPAAIRNRISKWIQNGSNIYIMTDEYEKSFFDPLKKHYQIFTFRDFFELEQLKEEDNFMLYEVEKIIAERAKIKVAMFNEYPRGGKQLYSLFDYSRSGTQKLYYLVIHKLTMRYREMKKHFLI
jgi:hypothetical protein